MNKLCDAYEYSWYTAPTQPSAQLYFCFTRCDEAQSFQVSEPWHHATTDKIRSKTTQRSAFSFPFATCIYPAVCLHGNFHLLNYLLNPDRSCRKYMSILLIAILIARSDGNRRKDVRHIRHVRAVTRCDIIPILTPSVVPPQHC